MGGLPLSASGGECLDRHREKLGHFAEFLGGDGEEELVSGSIWFSKAKPVELQDAPEMPEQHLPTDRRFTTKQPFGKAPSSVVPKRNRLPNCCLYATGPVSLSRTVVPEPSQLRETWLIS